MRNFCKLFILICVFFCSSLLFVGCGDDLILVTGIDLYKEEIYANLNDTIDLSYKVYPNNASNQKVSFWSTDESVASVDENGKVLVKSYGEASIVIRSLDGGFEDSCKIVTNIDPETIRWDTSDGKLTPVVGQSYSATSAMALNQVMKLKVDYLIEGIESDLVTNKNVTFTSSNTSNIQIINETEGIIKAINNEKISGDQAFADITATLQTSNGTLSLVCRVYINEFSSLDHLYLNYKNYNTKVLNMRNGSESIYLTSGGESIEFYSYITNLSNDVKTDYTMNIVSSDDNLFTVDNLSYEDGWYFFKLTPSVSNEGTGTLYITTTCSDESGKTIRCNVNVTVQAEISTAIASATDRVVNSTEVLLNGEIFSIDLTYFDSSSSEIEGATRDIYFEDLDVELLNYISNYGNNKFKVKAIPEDPTKVFSINGYFYVENVESSARKDFVYNFYLRNNLEGLIVSETRKTTEIPSYGVSSITIPVNGNKMLYAYATSYDFGDVEPSTIEVEYDNNLIYVDYSGGEDEFKIMAGANQGSTTIVFKATDGKIEIEYAVKVNIVAAVAEIKFYNGYSNGTYMDEVTAVETTANEYRIYFDIVCVDPNYNLENTSNIKVTSSMGEVKEEYDADQNKVFRYVLIDTSNLGVGMYTNIVLHAERVLADGIVGFTKK